jgi:hypothetical protein
MCFDNFIRRKPFIFWVRFILTILSLELTSCSSPPAAWNSKTSFSASAYQTSSDFGGEVVTEAMTTTATVVSVDHVKRLVVLKRSDGLTVTYRALPGALGFDVIQAGDQVKGSVAEEMAIFIGRNNLPQNISAKTARLRVRLPDGTQAAAEEVGTLVFTAKITAIDDWADTVTLQLPEGVMKTIKVSEFVNLADVSVGDTVSVQSTEAAVLMLEK